MKEVKNLSEKIRIAMSSDKQEYATQDKVKLKFSLINDYDVPTKVLKWNTPLEGFENDILNVMSGGKRSEYLGKIVYHKPPTPADYVTIEPGQSISVDFNVDEVYEIYENKDHSVEYNVDMMRTQTLERTDERDLAPQTPHRSETVHFKLVEPRQPLTSNGVRLDWMPSFSRAVTSDTGELANTYTGFTQVQKDTLNQASTNAENMAWKSKLQLQHLRQLVVIDEMLWADRFWKWFGGCGDSIALYMNRYDKVTDNFVKLHNAFVKKSIAFTIDHNHPNWYAYVYPTQPYNIYICDPYFTAPAMGTDSQAGILIHEMIHFKVVGAALDFGYGQTFGVQLAKTNPSKAILNADNYKYFAENKPFIPLGHNTFAFAQIRSYNGQYMVAEGGGGGAVNANRSVPSIWESFALIDTNAGDLNSGNTVHIQTYDGIHYVVAENGGGNVVKADRTLSREWETYRIIRTAGPGKINNGDKVNFQAFNGNWVCAEGGGGNVVNANRTVASIWETFKLEFI